MKEFILINYNIKIDKFYNNYFFTGDEKVKIINYKGEINKIFELYKLSNYLYYKNVPIDTFILNKEGKYYTKKNDGYIILMKINSIEEKIDLNYLKMFDVKNDLEYQDILELWKAEIDDLETKLIEFNKEYKIIQGVSNYYIGMAENAVTLMNEINSIDNNSIGIKISSYNLNNIEINNPFNYFKINKMYNISTYIKNKILTNSIDYNEIDFIINNIDNEINEIILFAYLLYPDYFFELIEKEMEEEKIKKIFKIIPIYEKLLSYLKENFNKNKKIKLFVWIK